MSPILAVLGGVYTFYLAQDARRRDRPLELSGVGVVGEGLEELAHRDNPGLKEAIAIKGCPPQPDQVIRALNQAGIMADPALFANLDAEPGNFLKRYKDRPDHLK